MPAMYPVPSNKHVVWRWPPRVPGASRRADQGAARQSADRTPRVLQIDSVNAVVRSHYLPLFSRLGNYSQTLLDQAAWSSGRAVTLFEYWGHEASLLPLAMYPLMGWRMRGRRLRARTSIKAVAKFGREHRHGDRAGATGLVREQWRAWRGQSQSTREEKAGQWWDWSAEKLALEWLFAAGEVTVAGRRGFERLYDLPERVLPGEVLNILCLSAKPTRSASCCCMRPRRWASAPKKICVIISGRTRCRCSYRTWRNWSRMAGQLATSHDRGPASRICLPDSASPGKVTASALLSPFDSLIWERARTERLFDFSYRLEIYTPQHKRVYGYYVLPFLHHERIAARVDLRAERAAGATRRACGT
jgi:uncharacterized protein YcaQ